MCAVRKPTCCHARLRRVRRADGSGAPSHCCTWSSWASTSPCKVSCTPWPANKPLMRLMTRVRSCFAVVSSRWSCRRSSSSTLGTRTTLHTFFSPALAQRHRHRLARTAPLALGAAFAPVDLNTGGIDDGVLDAMRDQVAVQPEPITASLVTAHDASVLGQAKALLRPCDLLL